MFTQTLWYITTQRDTSAYPSIHDARENIIDAPIVSLETEAATRYDSCGAEPAIERSNLLLGFYHGTMFTRYSGCVATQRSACCGTHTSHVTWICRSSATCIKSAATCINLLIPLLTACWQCTWVIGHWFGNNVRNITAVARIWTMFATVPFASVLLISKLHAGQC